MPRKTDPFGHKVPTIKHDFKPPLSEYPSQIVERMPKKQTIGGFMRDQLITAGVISCLWVTLLGVIYIQLNERGQRLEEVLDTRVAELDADNGILQLIFENSYDRNAIQLTEVEVSAYSSTRDQTDDTPWTTADGGNVMVGQIAVSRDLINRGLKFGSVVYLEGLGVFRVTDVMAPRWKNKIDIWCADKTACRVFGVRKNVTMIWMERP